MQEKWRFNDPEVRSAGVLRPLPTYPYMPQIPEIASFGETSPQMNCQEKGFIYPHDPKRMQILRNDQLLGWLNEIAPWIWWNVGIGEDGIRLIWCFAKPNHEQTKQSIQKHHFMGKHHFILIFCFVGLADEPEWWLAFIGFELSWGEFKETTVMLSVGWSWVYMYQAQGWWHPYREDH